MSGVFYPTHIQKCCDVVSVVRCTAQGVKNCHQLRDVRRVLRAPCPLSGSQREAVNDGSHSIHDRLFGIFGESEEAG